MSNFSFKELLVLFTLPFWLPINLMITILFGENEKNT